MLIKRRVPIDKLIDIEISMTGYEKCAKGIIKINDIGMGRGISGIELNLTASEKPEVTIEYHPHLITKEVSESLGIEKRPSYQKGN